MKVYLDVCCLNRPFDDQSYEIIHLESEAILVVLGYCEDKKWQLVSSEIVDFEISKIVDDNKREKVSILSSLAKIKITINSRIEKRAIELEKLGFGAFDALHVACAEESKSDILLTTDDKLLYRAAKYKNILKVKIENPLKWVTEVMEK